MNEENEATEFEPPLDCACDKIIGHLEELRGQIS